ncbi:MAG: NAD(P) transhydrogenase subunit alpha [Holosporales bacterium]|jgi:NAD(P) transhydrogenase subunit alpha|nr:NAD(P) transhydrogenase subunit alpha [Holosporales bacterium]
MKLYVLNEADNTDNRVSITPDISKKLVAMGHGVFVEAGAGLASGFKDDDYGSDIATKRDLSVYDVVFSVNPLTTTDTKMLRAGAIVISGQDPFNHPENLDLFAQMKITAFALDLIPRTSRAQYMDILSSQASLAGYKAVIEAAHILNRSLPLTMTTAGTIPAAKILVIGAGVAGLQAIATARRLGAIVSAFDVRTAAKEQVESLGAKFVEVEYTESNDGVYAKEMSDAYRKAQEDKLRSILPQQDIVITTAQIPGKRAPVILKADMVMTMKHDSVIIDLASKSGGNCELTEHGKTIEKDGVKICAFENILNLIPHDASRLFAKNVFAFFDLLSQSMAKEPDIGEIDDEIIRGTLMTYNGNIVNERCKL